MADNSIGRSFQRILFWNNFVTEKLNTEFTDYPEVKQEEGGVEDEQCCIDMSSAWISCGAVAAGEPLTDPLSLEEDRASGKAVAVPEVSSGALAAVQYLADTLIPQGRRDQNQEKPSTTRIVQRDGGRRDGDIPDEDCPLSARLRQTAAAAEGATHGQCGDPFRSRPGERAERKRYACATCGKSFDKPVRLSLHTRVHTDGRPYRCSFCERSFGSEWCLARHLRGHGGDRPYPCTVCGLAFRTQFNLELHAWTHAADAPGARGGARAKRASLPCSVCGRSFKSKASLTYHERTTCVLGVYAPPLKLCSNDSSGLADT